jgi:hypothetical protein
MERLISLLALLLAGPSLASAQEVFQATSGGTGISLEGTSSSYRAAGPDFSMSGSIS